MDNRLTPLVSSVKDDAPIIECKVILYFMYLILYINKKLPYLGELQVL